MKATWLLLLASIILPTSLPAQSTSAPASPEIAASSDAVAFDSNTLSQLTKGIHVQWKGVVDSQGEILLLKDGNTSYFAKPSDDSPKIALPKDGTAVVVAGVCDTYYKESDFTKDGSSVTVMIVLKDFSLIDSSATHSPAQDAPAMQPQDTNIGSAIEAWRVEMAYVRTNRPSHVNGFLVGGGGGMMGTIVIKERLSGISSDAFTCTLVKPVEADSDGWSAFVADNHAWSMSDVMLGEYSYPIIGQVKTSDGKVFTTFPAVFTAKTDIEAGGVQQSGVYVITSKRSIKAGDTVSALIVGNSIFSIEPFDATKGSSQQEPWLSVTMGAAK